MNIRQCRGNSCLANRASLTSCPFRKSLFLPWGCLCPRPTGAALAQPKEHPAMPIDLRRRDDIAAAVDAYNRTHPTAPLPRNHGCRAQTSISGVSHAGTACEKQPPGSQSAVASSLCSLSVAVGRLCRGPYLSTHCWPRSAASAGVSQDHSAPRARTATQAVPPSRIRSSTE